MDSDITRWRNIGATRNFYYPNEKIHLVKSKSHKTPAIAKQNIGLIPKHKPEPLKQIFDRFTKGQKQDVIDYSSGYLNPSKSNQILQKKVDARKEPIMFGKRPQNDKPEIEDMITILQKYDTVAIKENSPMIKEQEHLQKPKLKHFTPKMAPQNQHLSLTKLQKFELISKFDSEIIKPGKDIRHSDKGKIQTLRKLEKFLKTELESNNCPKIGPDRQRLEIYSQLFDKVILEFTTFGPILSEIKQEYDRTIESFQTDEQEFQFLRTKVQKLLSQNENRALLKYEKQKSKQLQSLIFKLTKKLKKDMVYKLAVYAAYLPESVLGDIYSRKGGTKSRPQTRQFEFGQDPISIRDATIAKQEAAIREKIQEIEHLKALQEKEYVPRVTKEKLEDNLKNLEEKFKFYSESNEALEAQTNLMKNTIKNLESSLRDKEQQYQFLVAEYSELSESLNIVLKN